MEIFAGWDLPLHWGLLLLMGLLLYIYATWPYGQFEKLGISGPPPQLFFGNQRQLMFKSTVYALNEWAKQYGRVYGIYMGRQPMVVISDLDILKSVLVKDFAHFTDRWIMFPTSLAKSFQKAVNMATGADWKRIRGIMTPAFSASKLRMMEPHINRCSQVLTDNLLQKAQQGEKINVKEVFRAYTLEVITSTLFGLKLDCQKDPNEPFLVNLNTLLGTVKRFVYFNALLVFMPCLGPVVGWMRGSRLFNEPLVFYVTHVKSMIEQRKANSESQSKPADFLQLMINAESSEDNGITTKRLTKDEIVSQMLIFFYAGFETMWTALQFLVYNLAMYPDVQQRIVTEIQQELGEEDPTSENVSRLKYLDQTIHESLRLHPPTTMTFRMASETVTINGVTIPKGFGVMVPLSEVMRDPEYFPDPDRFDPDRFGDKGGMEPISFLAFGYGPRMCLGMRLAMLEIKIAMVHALRKMQFVRTPDLPDMMQYKVGMASLLTSATPLLITAEPREAKQ